MRYSIKRRHYPQRPIISPTSVLCNLPSNYDKKQLLYLDGIRHAAEIADVAYRRLQRTLTTIANDRECAHNLLPEAFLDAWAFVDAFHRFCGLLVTNPKATRQEPDSKNYRVTFDEVKSQIYDLRNYADHIHQRLDQLVSKKGPVLGSLSWVTVNTLDHSQGISCMIVPGTFFHSKFKMNVELSGRKMEIPTGLVELKIADCGCCLSDAHAILAGVVISMEKSLAEGFSHIAEQLHIVGGDIVLRMGFEFSEEPEA